MIRNYKRIYIPIERQYIYVIKIFAIISIVSAHLTSIPDNSNKYNIISSFILQNIGNIGVPIFYLISGYLFFYNKHDFKNFFNKKIKTIILPWIVTGSIIFLSTAIRKGGLNLNNYIKFILGSGSYLYFLTILIVFYIIFFKIKNNIYILSLSIVISIVSILLTASGNLLNINSYLNCFNFMIYFVIGIILNKYNLLIKVGKIFGKYIYYILIIYILSIVVAYIYQIKIGYFEYSTLYFNMISIPIVLGLSTMKFFYNKHMTKWGIESFGIYLLHTPVAGLIKKILNHFDIWLLTIIRPIIVICIVMLFIDIYKYLSRKFNIEYISNSIIGVGR